MQEEKLKKAIDEWDAIIHENFHGGMINGASLATSETTSIIDKFSMWLLAGVGGTAALIIANIDKIIPYTGVVGFKFIVLFLCASAIFGFLSKYFSIVVHSSVAVSIRMADISAEELNKYSENCKARDEVAEGVGYVSKRDVDVNDFLNDYISLYPTNLLRKKIKKTFEKMKQDKLYGNRSAVQCVVYQSLCLLFQALFYVFFLISVAVLISIR
ncbi:hypothetical protein [Raoultella ornithinolytica]